MGFILSLSDLIQLLNKCIGSLYSLLIDNIDFPFGSLLVFCLLDCSGDREELNHSLLR